MSSTYEFVVNRRIARGLDSLQRRRARQTPPHVPPVQPSLKQLTPQQLHDVLEARRAKGDRAPGPDGVRLTDLSRSESWSICRQLAGLVQADEFRPSTARTIRLKKPDGSYREIRIRSLAFGLVAGAVHHVLQPKLEAIYLPVNYGFRPKLGRWHLLLALEQACAQDRWILTQNDVRKAFDNIPISLTMEAFRQYITDEPLLRLIETLLRGHTEEQKEHGIDQGSPLSSDALNVLFHIHLDDPLHRDIHQPPVYRFADNLATVTTGEPEGQARLDQVAELLHPLGMQLKYATRPVDLRKEETELLGLGLKHHEGRIRYSITPRSWKELQEELEKTWEKNPGNARNLIRGWMEANSATFENNESDQIDQIHTILISTGHRELSREAIRRQRQASADRWKAFRRGVLGA